MTSYRLKNFKKIMKDLDSGEKTFIVSGFILGLSIPVLNRTIESLYHDNLTAFVGFVLFTILLYSAFHLISGLEEEVIQDEPQ